MESFTNSVVGENYEDGGGDGVLCIFCCYSCSQSLSKSNNFSYGGIHNDEFGAAVLELGSDSPFQEFFAEVVLSKNVGRMDQLIKYLVDKSTTPTPKSSQPQQHPAVSVCQECYDLISEVIRTKNSVNTLESRVRSLQLEILEGLRDLESRVNKFKSDMDKIKQVVRASDVSCLKFKLDKVGAQPEEEMAKSVFLLRECILNGWTESKFHVEGSFERDHVKIEIEAEEDIADHFGDEYLPHLETEDFKTEPGTSIHIEALPTSNVSTNKQLKKRRKKGKKPNYVKRDRKPGYKLVSWKSYPRKRDGDPTFSCLSCPFRTKKEPTFEQHLREHEESCPEVKPFQCCYCPQTFSVSQYHEYHEMGHTGHHVFACEVCRKRIPAQQMSAHLQSHLLEGESIIQCDNCSYCCIKRKTYLNHLGKHSSTNAKASFTCDICSKVLSTRRDLFIHMRNEHGSIIKKLICDFPNCDKEFMTKTDLNAHKLKHKSENVVLPCPECDKRFQTRHGLEVHSLVHSGEKPFSCPDCSETFRYKPSLESHQMKAHGAPKYKCDLCEKEFSAKSLLSSHMKLHDGSKCVYCDQCGKAFGTAARLKRHASSHSEEKRFPCLLCGKGFKSSTYLNHHMNWHNGLKRWKCEHCDKAFTRKEYLTCHLRTHTGERPFVCDLCGKAFSQPTSLTIHKRNQHKK